MVYHVGLLCPAAIGHLNPMCNLGNELQRRGYKVTLFGIPDVQEKIAKSELGFYKIGANDFPPGSLDLIYTQQGKRSGFAGLKFALESFRRATVMMFREGPDAIKKADIDILLVDQTTSAGGTIADYLKLPFVTICSTLPIHQDFNIPPTFIDWNYQDVWWAKLRNQLGYQLLDYLTYPIWKLVSQQRRQWQLYPYYHRRDADSQLAQISQLPKMLDFPRENLPPYFHYVGPLKNPSDVEPISSYGEDFPFEALGNKPLIYANLGTLQSRNWEIFHQIAEACLDLDAQLLISLGNPEADLSKVNFPGSPLVFPFPPHQKLINRASVVITHAGSTAVSCLSAGVPMVAIPITADQPGMAARVSKVRAGEVVPLNKLNVSKLKASIEKVLRDQSYRNSAVRLSKAIQKSGGVNYAADIVEQVAATKAPVLNAQ
ncbi:MAG: nucleotide disphospho-sugar-binding domain-containing protein [Cyanobacteria bacterium J06635_1]